MRSAQLPTSNHEHPSIPYNISTYLLQDYTFLNEYTLIDSPINTQSQFLARINSTQQLVKFIKKYLLPTNTIKGLNMYKRFQAMFVMFQKGLILADNMFVLEEGQGKYFYYIIQPYLNPLGSQLQTPFVTLQQYLLENRNTILGFQSRKALFIKCKNLFDNLYQSGQAYCGLNSRKIVIDDQGNTFLLPFSLQFNLSTKPYQRSYYPLEVLKHLTSQNDKQPLKSLQKWDVWSFGCIVADIFLYLTPFFMSTSVQRQIHKILSQTQQIFTDFKNEFLDKNQKIIEVNTESQCSINQLIFNTTQEVRKILNFLKIAFNFDENNRKISFQPNQNQFQSEDKKFRLKAIKKSSRIYSKRQKVKNQAISRQKQHLLLCQNDFKELNILQLISQKQKKQSSEPSKQTFDFELKFKSLFLSKSQQKLKQEVQILVEFYNKDKFKFFIDLPVMDQQNMEWIEIQLNKKITFSNMTFQFFQKLLQEQVVVTIANTSSRTSENSQNSRIFINLSALLIKNQQGIRMWNKPIKGSYATQSDDFISCKMRVEASLIETKTYQSQENCSRIKLYLSQDKLVQSQRIPKEQIQQTSRFPTDDKEQIENRALKPNLQHFQSQNQKVSLSKQKIQKSPQVCQTLQSRAQRQIKQSKTYHNELKQSELSSKLKRLLIR